MAKSCHVHPIIIDNKGKEVPSKLWGDLLKLNNNRGWVKRIYEGVHTDYFIDKFGDWIDDPDNASLAVDEHGEPKIITMISNVIGEELPIFLIAKDETTYQEVLENGGVVAESDLAPGSYFIIDDVDGGNVDITKQRRVHSDPRIQKAFDETKSGAHVIDNTNNPYVWDIEKEYDLINVEKSQGWMRDKFSGNAKRIKRVYSRAKAKRIAEKINKEKPGYSATIKATYNPKRGTTSKYQVVVAYDITQPSSAHERLLGRGERFSKIKAEMRERFSVMFLKKDALTDLEKLHKKVMDAFQKRIAIMERKYDFIQRQDFDEFLDEFLDNNNVTSAIISAIKYSSEITKQLYDRYAKIQKNNEPLTAKILQTWSDFLIAYDTLDELQNLVLKDPSIIQDPKIVEQLRRTIDYKDFIKSLYETEGVKLLAEFLSPFYNGIRAKKKQQLESEYRREYYKRKKGREYSDHILEKTESEYIETRMRELKYKLDSDTKELLQKELVTASRDISVLSRWIDNMLDTADPISAAVVNAFVRADEEARMGAIKKRTEVIKELTELEKNKPKGSFTSEIKYYSFLLEFDEEGNPKQWLLRPWVSDLVAEELKQRRRIYKDAEFEDADFVQNLRRRTKAGEITKEEARSIRRKEMALAMDSWRKANLQMYTDEYDEAGVKYMQSLIGKVDPITGEEVVTEKMVKEIEMNIIGKYYTSPKTMFKEGRISEEAAELYSKWRADNYWKYTNVIDKWKNPQWDRFMKKLGISVDMPYYRQLEELDKSENPEAKFYVYINKLAREADSKVPFTYRLGGRLPGVPKIQSERIKEGQDPITIAKNTFDASFFVRPEDTERGDLILTDEQGNPKMFLPIHYVNQIELENQSFDIPGIYFRFWESANDYNIKRQILPELEMAKYFIDQRDAKKRNTMDKFIMSKLKMRGKGNIDELDDQEGQIAVTPKKKTQIAAQFEDWFEMAVYGKKAKPGSLWHITDDVILDTAKLVDAMNKYTSVNMLAINLVQGAANVLIGETMQAIDAFAGEHVSTKSLTKATAKYTKWLPGMMGDWGARTPSHVGSMLIEWANVLHNEVTDVAFSKKTKVGQHFDMSTMFMVQQAGEHWLQGRFLFALLEEKRALNGAGEDIGSMLDQYYVEDGELKIKDEVSLTKSKWTISDQESFKRRAIGLLSRMHGEYSELGRVALQRVAIGRMVYMFRKFVVPGFKRRWAKARYIERLGQETEGNYISMMKFVNNLRKDLKIFNAAMMSEEWAALNDHERANIMRALGETVAVLTTSVLAGFLYKKSIEEDDEDDWMYAYWAYQAYRLQTEMLFFTPKLDETMTILRSPAASMAIAENAIKLLDQMFTPLERYERGPWKGEYKIKKTMINFVPLWKQWYKARDIEEQIQWFK